MPRYISIRVTDPKEVKPIKSHLEAQNALNKRVKIKKDPNGVTIFSLLELPDEYLNKYQIDHYEEDSQSSNPNSLNSIALENLKNEAGALEPHIEKILLSQIPKKWSLYPPMILFSSDTFDSQEWQTVLKGKESEFFAKVVQIFPNISHVAVNKPIIESDLMRRPFNITPMYGDFGPIPTSQLFDSPSATDFANAFWCSVVQNGIKQFWAPLYTMFSRGNIKEKKRVLTDFKCKDTVVFDLYCGIGYFSLSYLKNGCSNIFCWELNPWSIKGFTKALDTAKHTYKVFTRDDAFSYSTFLELKNSVTVFIFQESNEYVPSRLKTFPPKALEVSHINLGLLPTSQGSWEIARGVAKNTSYPKPQVHVHENVHIDDFDKYRQKVGEALEGKVVHLEKVKTFAPDVWHVVIDVEIEN